MKNTDYRTMASTKRGNNKRSKPGIEVVDSVMYVSPFKRPRADVESISINSDQDSPANQNDDRMNECRLMSEPTTKTPSRHAEGIRNEQLIHAQAYHDDRRNKYDKWAVRSLNVEHIQGLVTNGINDLPPTKQQEADGFTIRPVAPVHLLRILDPMKVAYEGGLGFQIFDLSKRTQGMVRLTVVDGLTCRPGVYLNDNVIHAYGQYLNKICGTGKTFYCLDPQLSQSFFGCHLLGKATRRNRKVRRLDQIVVAYGTMTLSTLLEEKRVVGWVYHVTDVHWIALGLMLDRKTNNLSIKYYDSLGSDFTALLEERMKQPLKEALPRVVEISFKQGKCPRQTDAYMCGACSARCVQEMMVKLDVPDVIKYVVNDDFRYVMLMRILGTNPK
jgi:hypothetical protein